MKKFIKTIVWWVVLLFAVAKPCFPNPVSLLYCILILISTFAVAYFMAN